MSDRDAVLDGPKARVAEGLVTELNSGLPTRWRRLSLFGQLAALRQWPLRTYADVRQGCLVIVAHRWAETWDDVCEWLTEASTLTDVETFFVEDERHGLLLLVTGYTP